MKKGLNKCLRKTNSVLSSAGSCLRSAFAKKKFKQNFIGNARAENYPLFHVLGRIVTWLKMMIMMTAWLSLIQVSLSRMLQVVITLFPRTMLLKMALKCGAKVVLQ
ncbi:hypothetical protein AAW31_13615 [Nitrosomonas communis]|uniref:Uncharacterized protein n=1 Tax=Nitrosomonas communis TaxID=44574 RepID=A0A0F7KIC7_9PROT|nr:hypothetical protein AAW31_13615 [Nitrosomonas communis]